MIALRKILSSGKPFRTLRLLCFVASIVGLASCINVEEKRIRELLIEKGFGTRAEGVASMENYVAGGDSLVFLVDPALLMTPGAEQLALLTVAQRVGIDGTILVPYVGPVMVLGMTERELKRMVETQLQAFFNVDVLVHPRILDGGKVFYAFGEVIRRGQIPYFKADLTIFEAVSLIVPTPLANLGRVQLIKPDAENPLVITVNIREMITSGNMRYNVWVGENDFIYIPPTWFGTFARFIEKLLQPVSVAVQALFGATYIQQSYRFLTGDTDSPFFLRF